MPSEKRYCPIDKNAAARLTHCREQLMHCWETRVLSLIPSAKLQSKIQLRNSLPKFLDRLAEALAPTRLRPTSQEEVNEVSEKHGQQRGGLEGYSLPQMLAEYRILREVIFQVLEESTPDTCIERDIILTSIEEGMTEASICFMALARNQQQVVEERFRLVVEGVQDDAIILINPAGQILEWNTGAENIMQFRREEMIGHHARKFFTPEDQANSVAEQEIEKSKKTGKAEDKRWHLKKDGSWFFANGIMNSLKDYSGNLIGFVKVLRDDTQKSTLIPSAKIFFAPRASFRSRKHRSLLEGTQ